MAGEGEQPGPRPESLTGEDLVEPLGKAQGLLHVLVSGSLTAGGSSVCPSCQEFTHPQLPVRKVNSQVNCHKSWDNWPVKGPRQPLQRLRGMANLMRAG